MSERAGRENKAGVFTGTGKPVQAAKMTRPEEERHRDVVPRGGEKIPSRENGRTEILVEVFVGDKLSCHTGN